MDRALGLVISTAVLGACGAPPAPPPPSDPPPARAVRSAPTQLIEVPHPPLGGLDPKVAALFERQRARLGAVIQKPGATAAQVSEHFGQLGQHYQAYNYLEAAAACYHNALSFTPSEFRWWYYLGLVRQRQGQADESTLCLENALALRPNHIPALLALGETHMKRGQPRAAQPYFKRARARDRSSAAAYYGLGRIALADQSYAEAVELLEESARLAPNASAVQYALGMAYRGTGNLEQAAEHLRQGGEVPPPVPDPLRDQLDALQLGAMQHMTRGTRAVQAGDVQSAAIEFQQAVAAAPNDPWARINLGAALAQIGDPDGAQKQFATALELDPGSAKAHFNLGLLSAQRGDDQAALAHYRRALELDPRDEEAQYALGNALRRHRHFDQAAVHFARAAELAPENAAAHIGAAMSLVQLQRCEAAQVALEQAYEQRTDHLDLAQALARLLSCCESGRDPQRALELARRAYRGTSSFDAAEAVAMAYAAGGDYKAAARWQEAALAAAEKASLIELAVDAGQALDRYRSGRPCRAPWRTNASPTPTRPLPVVVDEQEGAGG